MRLGHLCHLYPIVATFAFWVAEIDSSSAAAAHSGFGVGVLFETCQRAMTKKSKVVEEAALVEK